MLSHSETYRGGVLRQDSFLNRPSICDIAVAGNTFLFQVADGCLAMVVLIVIAIAGMLHGQEAATGKARLSVD